MRLGKAKILGNEYYLALTPRVLKNLQDRTGRSISEELRELEKSFDISGFIDLLEDMLVAGDRYATLNDMEHVKAPSKDDLYDLIGLDEFTTMFGAVVDATRNGGVPEIETAQPKNAEATQED